MLQHVSIEIPAAEAERTVEFWALLGFTRVEPPEPLAGYVTWLEREGTQIHLIHTDEASVPVLGHVAVVAPDFQQAFDRVAEAGFEIEESRQLWGARRAFAIAPAGHRVELMAGAAAGLEVTAVPDGQPRLPYHRCTWQRGSARSGARRPLRGLPRASEPGRRRRSSSFSPTAGPSRADGCWTSVAGPAAPCGTSSRRPRTAELRGSTSTPRASSGCKRRTVPAAARRARAGGATAPFEPGILRPDLGALGLHAPDGSSAAWMLELHRLLKPDGLLIATYMGRWNSRAFLESPGTRIGSG